MISADKCAENAEARHSEGKRRSRRGARPNTRRAARAQGRTSASTRGRGTGTEQGRNRRKTEHAQGRRGAGPIERSASLLFENGLTLQQRRPFRVACRARYAWPPRGAKCATPQFRSERTEERFPGLRHAAGDDHDVGIHDVEEVGHSRPQVPSRVPHDSLATGSPCFARRRPFAAVIRSTRRPPFRGARRRAFATSTSRARVAMAGPDA